MSLSPASSRGIANVSFLDIGASTAALLNVVNDDGSEVFVSMHGHFFVGEGDTGAQLHASSTDGLAFRGYTNAPADATLSSGECALWFDETNGAAKLMVKAKQADGTVKTAAVALA